MTSRIFLLVTLGGGIGSLARYLVSTYFSTLIPSNFPFGTFAVNVVGCLLIGIVYALSEQYAWLSPTIRVFLATGIIGGFTTFSSFIYENVSLLQEGKYLTFVAYSLISYVSGIVSVFGGLFIIKGFSIEL